MEKQILNYKFKFVTEINPERNDEGEIIGYNYKDKAKSEGKTFNTYGGKTFCSLKLKINKDMQGLYALYIDDELYYIGETSDLRARWSSMGYGHITYKNSLLGGQTTNCMVNSSIYDKAKDNAKIKLYFCEHLSAEREIIIKEQPKLNKLLNKIKGN